MRRRVGGGRSRRLPRAVLLPALLVATGCGEGTDAPAAGGTPDARADDVQAVGELSPFQTRKVEGLLRDRLPCLGCHVLDGEGGRIGPDLSAVGARVSRAEIRAVVADPREARPGSVMPRVPMPERWRELVVAYLAGRSGGAEPAPDPGPRASPPPERGGGAASGPPDGEALYGRWCAACHGAAGAGDGPNARFLPAPPTAHSDAAYMAARPDDALFDAVWAGGRVMGRSHRMPPFGETLSRGEIRALVEFMRELCDCRGPAWSRDGRGAP